MKRYVFECVERGWVLYLRSRFSIDFQCVEYLTKVVIKSDTLTSHSFILSLIQFYEIVQFIPEVH